MRINACKSDIKAFLAVQQLYDCGINVTTFFFHFHNQVLIRKENVGALVTCIMIL